MNLQTWAKFVKELNAITGGCTVELSTGPFDGMTIGVRWRYYDKLIGYDHTMSLGEMKRMYAVTQPCVLESITNAVRKMTPNVEVSGLRGFSRRSARLPGWPSVDQPR